MDFFPTALTETNFTNPINKELEFTTYSGTQALRLLLRSLRLPQKAKVAIPAFVCSAVKAAVIVEGFIPVYLDLKGDHSFWTEYSTEEISNSGAQCVILVHLYGFLHPDTSSISAFCKANGIKLIHDAAQCYGIDKKAVSGDNGIVYSFGPGKSTTAAGGGWIIGIDKTFYDSEINNMPFYLFPNKKAEISLSGRIYNHHTSAVKRVINKLITKIKIPSGPIYKMANYQMQAASLIISILDEINIKRNTNYHTLQSAALTNTKFSVAYYHTLGGYFKIVLFVKENPALFKEYLRKNSVPHLFLRDYIETVNLPNFLEKSDKFVELSCEACLPPEEIKRVAKILADY